MDGALTGEHTMAATQTEQHTALNRRRMLGAPFAFAQAGLWLPLLQRCLCNYEWLEARCKHRSAMVTWWLMRDCNSRCPLFSRSTVLMPSFSSHPQEVAELITRLEQLHEVPSTSVRTTFRLLKRFMEAVASVSIELEAFHLHKSILAHLPAATEALANLRAQVSLTC